jgi:preprotein translocase subunit SecD
MNRSLLARGLLILAVVAFALVSVYPIDESVKLGLDLRGGIHLVLEVQAEDALRAETDKDLDTLLGELQDEHGLVSVAATRTDDNSFEVTGVPRASDDAVSEVVDRLLQVWTWRRSGDLVRFSRRIEEVGEIREQAVRQALQTIRNRVDAFGVAEPVIQRQGLASNRIVVQLPGVDDPERVKELIKNTAFLEFRMVDYPGNGASASSEEEIVANYGGQLPANVQIFPHEIRDEAGLPIRTGYLALEQRQVITGRDLRTARAGLGQFNEPVVYFFLKPEGARLFGETTGANIGRYLAIVLDGKVRSAPQINGKITDEGTISGGFTQQEVEDLVTVLRSGSLPAGIKYLEDRAVGPTLGQDSIDQGLRAGLAGGALIVLAMLVVYRRSGINAVAALSLNIVVVFALLAYVGATLTLPGIAGIILTVGMAVDANVLIFERIKEELRAGRTVKTAISSGFSKALSSILDANVTTLIAAMFLFQFGTGPIRGFAVTLTFGILASLFSAVFTSRWIFDVLLSRRSRVETLSI